MKKLTPVLYVEEIEPCLPFWVERLGFQKVTEVPEGNKLGFVILVKDNVQVMYQSRASLEKDIPALAKQPFKSSTILYVDVEKLDEIVQKLEGAEVVGRYDTNEKVGFPWHPAVSARARGVSDDFNTAPLVLLDGVSSPSAPSTDLLSLGN